MSRKHSLELLSISKNKATQNIYSPYHSPQYTVLHQELSVDPKPIGRLYWCILLGQCQLLPSLFQNYLVQLAKIEPIFGFMKQTKYNSASLLAKLFTKVSASWSGTCSGLLSGASFTCWFAAYSICAFSNSSLDASYTNQSKTNQNEPPLPLSPMDPWIELRCSDYRVNRFLLEPTLRTDSPSAC